MRKECEMKKFDYEGKKKKWNCGLSGNMRAKTIVLNMGESMCAC